MGLRTNNAKQKKDTIRLLRLTFSSHRDLLKFSRDKEAVFSTQVYLCDKNKQNLAPLFDLPSIKVDNLEIGLYSNKEVSDLEEYRKTDRRILYHAFVPLAGDEPTKLFGGVSVVDRIPFLDLPASTRNICFQLNTGAMWFELVAKSNTIVFPRAQLTEAWGARPDTATQKPN